MLRKKLFFLLILCFGIVIFRLGGQNCVKKNEKCIVFLESRYIKWKPDGIFYSVIAPKIITLNKESKLILHCVIPLCFSPP